jgi:2-dehydro-3-deoxyphosphogluconate aldolase/(4S)-4-hydroxy-2-oxoglutarate aldolase
MARFSRLHVYARLAETGMVPVFYHPDPETCRQVLAASYRAGVRVFEFTNRGDGAHEIFNELNQYAALEFPEMILGVGTIFDTGTASLYIQLGAAFVVSPALKEDLAVTCNRRKIAWIPGCATLTEISRAEELGAEMVKVFPGDILGPEFIKALKGPMPWTTVIVTGGVKPEVENLKAWFDAGAACVGIGSQLFAKNLLANKEYQTLEENIRKTMQLVHQVKK